MKDKTRKHYDNLYSREDNVFGKGKPLPILKKALEFVSSGKVLDIGAGEGRNSIFLAQNGFDVKALDVSKVAIEKLKKKAQELNLDIDAEVRDITKSDLPENYDFILISFSLHHLSREQGEKLLGKVKEKTNKGGLNVITALTNKGDFFKNPKNQNNFYPAPGELKEIYKDWEIISYLEKETTAHQKNEQGENMKNLTSFLIVRK